MNVKFVSKKVYNIAHGFLEGNGFCFRSRRMDNVIEFHLIAACREACTFFDKLGLEDKYNLVD